MVCLVKHSKAHYPHLSPRAGSTCIISSIFTCARNLPANITLSCTVHSPMHDLEMSNGCACNCFYPGCKGFARLSRIHVRKKTGKVLTLEKSCLVSAIASQFNTSILQTNQTNYSENDVGSLLHWSKVKCLFDVFFPNCGSHKHKHFI